MRVMTAVSSLGVALSGFVAGWRLGGNIVERRAGLPNMAAQAAPPAEKPLRIEQRVRVECAGRVYEGIVTSIFVEDGQAVIRVSDHICEPLNEQLWTWEDDGASVGN